MRFVFLLAVSLLLGGSAAAQSSTPPSALWGGPLTATDSVVSVSEDRSFELANLTPSPVVLDSLVMRFSEVRPIAWIMSTESGASPAFQCSFDPYRPSGQSACSAFVIVAPAAAVRVSVYYDPCIICRPGPGARDAPDTLLVYSGGVAIPDTVLFDDANYVDSEEAPRVSGLAITVGPNPSRGAATVSVTVAVPVASARVVLADAIGRRVAVLHDGGLPVGTAQFAVPPDLTAGAYLVRAEAGDRTAAARLTVVR